MQYFAFAGIMYGFAILFIVFGILIYRGKTNLIHSYHQTKVKDKEGYGKAFGKTFGCSSLTFMISGSIPLIMNTESSIVFAIVVFGCFFLLFLFLIFKVQKKYNNGI